MKKIFAFVYFCSLLTLPAQALPIAGKTFTLSYDASVKGIFSNDSKLSVIYVFDFWGTKYTFSYGAEGLFKNVLEPDASRLNQAALNFTNGSFSAEIMIPENAQLLSFYITDKINFDYNDNKTYSSYVYNEAGKPVKGARFRNVDFLLMAGLSIDECISELKNELIDYPDYHLARFVLWDKKLSAAKSFDELKAIRNEYENEFAGMIENSPEDYDLLNSFGRVHFSYQQSLYKLLMPQMEEISQILIEIAKKIPDGKRNANIERIYQSHIQQQKSQKFSAEITGKPSIDFDFITLEGVKKKLSDYKGKIVLLDFWGTWCGPCVEEIPNLVKAYEKFKEKGFEIISISSDLMMKSQNEEEFKKFIKDKNMNWTHVLDDRSIHTLYNISHWPTLYLIDENGIVIKNELELRGEDLIKTLAGALGKN